MMHVVAGVLIDAAGRVLLAQRPPGKHLAGMWEFPGGKLEPGEGAVEALRRELHEEIGIELIAAEPLVRIPWRYGERGMLLDAWRVVDWLGTAHSREGQGLQWQHPTAVDSAILAPADRPILNALRLSPHYPITPPDVTPEGSDLWAGHVRDAIARGTRLVQLRLPLWSTEEVRALAADLLPTVREAGAVLMLNGDIEAALALGDGVGVHLRSSQLAALEARPLPQTQYVGASCHDAAELAQASAIGIDFATLSPVALTASHPEAAPLGWERFQSLVEAASLPVYALGGITAAHLATARACGAQGIAGIRGFWP
jgi:8-oxo-dGTP diphosphatase